MERHLGSEDHLKVRIRRQWNHWKIAEVEYSKLSNIHWDRYSGSGRYPCPQYFIHANVVCNDIEGEIAHSCPPPYQGLHYKDR